MAGELINDEGESRLSMQFDAGEVFADYHRMGSTLLVTHVEADPALRGGGAAGQFMRAVVDWARAHDERLTPRCSYAVAWFKRHPDAADVLSADRR